MVLSIVVDEKEFRDFPMNDFLEGKDITVTGKVESMHVHDGVINQALKKEEMFDNLVALGVIPTDILEEIGYVE